MTDRRSVAAPAAVALSPGLADSSPAARPRRILLRSGWQTENIGDVAHTPAALALIERHLPGTEVVFWPHYAHLPAEEVAMLLGRFPALRIVQGALDAHDAPPADVLAAMQWADFMLHNSGPATLGWRECAAFRRLTGRSFGVFGVTYGLYGIPEKQTLSDAAFVYFRDSVSLGRAKQDGVHAPIMTFGPDAAFATDCRDDTRAEAYLKSAGLEAGQFVVVLPKQRQTPAWLHKHKDRPYDAEKDARNEAMAEHDHTPLREAITTIVRRTPLKVLIGHEDETALPIGKSWVYDRLPADVRQRVVWRDTLWFVDEAVSLYARSAGMVSLEMHGPILCVGQGVPAVVCRWAEQSSKGTMWRDIGLGEWLLDFDYAADVNRLPAVALAMAQDGPQARVKAGRARAFVRERYAEAMNVLARAITAGA